MTPEEGAGGPDIGHEGEEQTVSGGGGEGYLPIPAFASCPSPLHANEAVVDEDGRGEGGGHHGEGRGGFRGRGRRWISRWISGW